MEDQNYLLHRFTNSVNLEVDMQIDEVIAEAEQQRKEMLERAENDALNDAYKKIQKAVKKIEAKYHRNYAKKEQELKNELLMHRDSLIKSIFDAVTEKVQEFVNSDEYTDYLISLIKTESVPFGATILLSKKDMIHKEKIMSVVGYCVVEEDPTISLGGLSILNKDTATIIDKTLDTALKENRKSFSRNYSFSRN